MPPFRFPFFYHPPYYNRYPNVNYYNQFKPKNNFHKTPIKQDFSNISNVSQSPHLSPPLEKSDNKNSCPDDFFFDIFGLKLFFDDILLICIIFFLVSRRGERYWIVY